MTPSATIYRAVCLLLIFGQLAITRPAFMDWLAGRPEVRPWWYASRFLGAATLISLAASVFVAAGHRPLHGRRQHAYVALLALATASLMASFLIG